MSEATNETAPGNGKVRRLSDAVRRVRVAEVERTDAFADLHDAERARLALLAEELAGVFSEIPEDDDYFICRIGGGMPPRLWVDPTSHVVIGRDRRTYRFVKDTRLGRIVLTESTDPAAMADAVTDYVAERILERERAQESDLLLARMRDVALPRTSPGRAETAEADDAGVAADQGGAGQPNDDAAGFADGRRGERPGEAATGTSFALWLLVAFLVGLPTGAVAMIVYAWFRIGN